MRINSFADAAKFGVRCALNCVAFAIELMRIVDINNAIVTSTYLHTNALLRIFDINNCIVDINNSVGDINNSH
jgi:hypothetical protein